MSKQNPIRAHTATNFRYFSDRLLDQFLLDDRTRLRHGGAGYGPDDPRDAEDRKFLEGQRNAEAQK